MDWRARRYEVHDPATQYPSSLLCEWSTAQARAWANLVFLPASAILGTCTFPSYPLVILTADLTLGRRGFDPLLLVFAGQVVISAYV